ncbi:MAG: bifunctional 23S rRNA (guanine(2069)-N(7))-methyltransferase RlmK/23S rRNA (guanine(2445)-N(2))-methyltransferase RlmL [Coriobacteriales bacterium]
MEFTATCPKGVEPLLAAEMVSLGATGVRETRAAVSFSGPLEAGYRACLWSRLASRVLLTITEFPAVDSDELYAGVAAVPWEHHVRADGTIAIDAVGTTPQLTHTGFIARRVKDAIVDRIREREGRRPSVDLARPDVRVNVRLHKGRASVSIDLAGDPLHERGYRATGKQAQAPLKENLAAAVLVRAGWPGIAEQGGALLDPMCGSGTLLIEGALMAGDQAPGLLRPRWGFEGWLGHDEALWASLVAEEDDRAEAGRAALPLIVGWDVDPEAVALARACVARAGLRGHISVQQRDVGAFEPPAGAACGLVVANPPYGVRLGAEEDLRELHARLGTALSERFSGWRAVVLTSERDLARATGLRSSSAYTLFNGAIEVKAYVFDVSPTIVRAPVRAAAAPPSPGAEMVANRLRKNLRRLGRWARREGVTCFRVYDADLPEYAAAIDLYETVSGERYAHVAEYAPPRQIDPARAEQHLRELLGVIPDVLGVSPQHVAVKVRQRQRGRSQYERLEARGEFLEVAEGSVRLLVNLWDYLDTGLFLDHRPVRSRLAEAARGMRFCNLFAYTGAASVHAAAGGAATTTTVDMSSTYLGWARRSMALNGFVEGTAHRFVRADALSWLPQERMRVERGVVPPYDLVFCDPPTFSTSKTMKERTFDVQRDHVPLLEDAASLLAPRGLLIFSTNLRSFHMDAEALVGLEVRDITAETIPFDFARTPKVHRCFEIRVR